MRKLHHITLLAFLCLSFGINAQQYTGTSNDFATYKPIYKNHDWQFLEYDRYRIYFYGVSGVQNQAHDLGKYTEVKLKQIETFFDTEISEKIDIILFNSYHDYYYSNVNQNVLDEENIGGEAPINRHRVSIYATGSQTEVYSQLGEGIADAVLNNIFYGGGWKDALKNNTLLDFPEWYFEGLKSYLANDWDNYLDDITRQGILSGSYKKYHKLQGESAKYAGHAIWKYIADFYGENVIPNIIYLTRISTNIESGLAYVLGTNLSRLTQEFYNHYYTIYSKEPVVKNKMNLELIPLKIKNNESIVGFTLSPNKQMAAMAIQKDGKFKWLVYDVQKQSFKKINASGHKYVDATKHFAPVLAWHPTGDAISFFYNEKGICKVDVVELNGETTTKTLDAVDFVRSASYSSDGKQIALSASKDAQSDIYLYSFLGNALINLTNDANSDHSPTFLNKNEIIYTHLKGEKNDVYSVNIKTFKKSQLTSTPTVNEIFPIKYGNDFSYLADSNGIYNRYKARMDSTISHVDTVVHYRYFTETELLSEYPSSATYYESLNDKNYLVGFNQLGKPRFYLGNFNADNTLSIEDASPTYYERIRRIMRLRKEKNEAKVKINNSTTNPSIKYEKEVIDFSDETSSKPLEEQPKTTKKETLGMPSTRFYSPEFSITSIVSQLDHSFLNKTYQKYNELGFINPGISVTIKANLQDIFNDYRISGGIRQPFNFRSNEQFLSLSSLKKQTNKGFEVSRSAFRNNFLFSDTDTREQLLRVNTYKINGWVQLPFNPISGLKYSFGFRYDLTANLGYNQQGGLNVTASINEPTNHSVLINNKLEYIFNNSISPRMNVRYGFRSKVFVETFNNIENPLGGHTITAGGDFRHYQKISKGIVWANRFNYATSFGSEQVLYYLGGQDNWFFPQYNNQIALPEEGSYTFQTVATPMRGFIQNSRNGSSYAVFNSELRVPLIKYFSVEPLRSEFLEHFQVIGFADVGSAWTGLHPYSNDNAFNVRIVNRGPITVRIKNTQEPLIYGYGFGVRSKVFGYYMRFDWSWGVDDGETNSVRYFTIALDF